MTKHAKAQFEIKSWDENPYNEVEGAPKLTRASVTQAYSGDIEGEGKLEYLFVYGDDGSATIVGIERLSGTVGGRSGSFVLQGNGKFEKGAARCSWDIVPGSGTGDLAKISGKASYVAIHGVDKVNYTLDYVLS